MTRSLSAFVLLALAWPALGQSVKLPPEVKGGVGNWIVVKATVRDTKDTEVNWKADDGLQSVDILDLFPPEAANKLRVYQAFRPGRYRVDAWSSADADRPADKQALRSILADKTLTDAVKLDRMIAVLDGVSTCWVVVGDPGPVPPPPPPPGKVVVPAVVGKGGVTASAAVEAAGLVPRVVGSLTDAVTAQSPAGGELVERGSAVTLTTTVEPPAPIPLPGLRVLIVEESAARDKLPPGQYNAIFSKAVREYLRTHCVTPNAWGIWDQNADVSAYGPEFVAAMKRPRTSLPWLIISNHPKGGYEGPLPGSVEETMKLLKKHGGE